MKKSNISMAILFCLIVLFTGITKGKSLYTIADTSGSKVEAYEIIGNSSCHIATLPTKSRVFRVLKSKTPVCRMSSSATISPSDIYSTLLSQDSPD